MADLPPYPDSKGDTGDDTGVGPDRGSTTSRPRWVVKVFLIIALVLVLVFVVVMHLIGGGLRGPH
jgi:hypothetical protein